MLIILAILIKINLYHCLFLISVCTYYSIVKYLYLTILRLASICILMMVVDAAETCQNTPKYYMKSVVIALKIVVHFCYLDFLKAYQTNKMINLLSL